MSHTAFVCWLTGLPCSGKTTLARALLRKFEQNDLSAELLDGDELRGLIGGRGFSRDERNAHLKHWALTASLLERHGVVTICSFVSPYREARAFARKAASNFFEIYLNPPAEACEKRDVKGMYRKARAGEILNFTGVDDPYEPPELPDITIDTAATDLQKSVELVLTALTKKGWIKWTV